MFRKFSDQPMNELTSVCLISDPDQESIDARIGSLAEQFLTSVQASASTYTDKMEASSDFGGSQSSRSSRGSQASSRGTARGGRGSRGPRGGRGRGRAASMDVDD